MSGDAVTPQLQAAYAALGTFIALVTGLPAGQVVQGLPNRASMPMPGFISMQGITRRRLRTNVHVIPTDPDPSTMNLEEGVELSIQIDCYGPESTDPAVTGAEDWATILSTTLRDEYGCTQLAPTLSPLYADDATMVPLVDGEDQYEERWMVNAVFQYNPVTTIPQQYADVVDLTMIDVPSKTPT